jgi:DNA-binding SARP family transcriptional activator
MNYGELVEWFGGESEIAKLLQRNVRRDEASAASDAYDKTTDTFDTDKWLEAMSGGGAAATQSELEDELDRIRELMFAIVTNNVPEFAPFDPSSTSHKAKIDELKSQKVTVEQQLAKKAESNRLRVENRKKNEEAKGV